MKYKYKKAVKGSISVMGARYEGETIERKVERITTQKEPIRDGAPEIHTERSAGIQPAFNIRTDRFEFSIDTKN